MASYNGPVPPEGLREDPYRSNGLVGTERITVSKQLLEVDKLVGQIESNLGCPFGNAEGKAVPSSGRMSDLLENISNILNRLARIEEQTKLLG